MKSVNLCGKANNPSKMSQDIREKTSLTHGDILKLNFIRAPGKYYFRRHFKMGLRSHIMEVLRPQDVVTERRGICVNGVMQFPRAVPIKIMRLFRSKFSSLEDALLEINRVKLMEKYLSPSFMAQSEEFLVHYAVNEGFELLLCGLQVYVKGETLDPWTPMSTIPFKELLQRMLPVNSFNSLSQQLISRARCQLEEFVVRIKKMILESRHIPDLAGVGNILLTPSGDTVLVDINNISRVEFTDRIYLDDRGYPVCDKSVQALYLLEKKLTGTEPNKKEKVYKVFMDEERLKAVRSIEIKYHFTMN